VTQTPVPHLLTEGDVKGPKAEPDFTQVAQPRIRDPLTGPEIEVREGGDPSQMSQPPITNVDIEAEVEGGQVVEGWEVGEGGVCELLTVLEAEGLKGWGPYDA
jgi:hypothetical protein